MKIDISDIKGLDAYRSVHDPVSLAKLTESIDLHGLKCPVILGPGNMLISGSRRIRAMQGLGETRIECVQADTLRAVIEDMSTEIITEFKLTIGLHKQPYTLDDAVNQWLIVKSLRVKGVRSPTDLRKFTGEFLNIQPVYLSQGAKIREAALSEYATDVDRDTYAQLQTDGNVEAAMHRIRTNNNYERRRHIAHRETRNSSGATITDVPRQRRTLSYVATTLAALAYSLPQIEVLNPRITDEELEHFMQALVTGRRALNNAMRVLTAAEELRAQARIKATKNAKEATR